MNGDHAAQVDALEKGYQDIYLQILHEKGHKIINAGKFADEFISEEDRIKMKSKIVTRKYRAKLG